jgi:PGF-CTERM protein
MRGALLVVVCLALSLVAVGGVAGASVVNGGTHGNHLAIDSQASSDGTVVVETMSTLTSHWVVLRADDGGEPGESLGHIRVGTGFQTRVPIEIEDDHWQDWQGNRTVWGVIHRDDGDGEFEVSDDPPLTRSSPGAQSRFRLQKSDTGSVRVLAAQFAPQKIDSPEVTVARAELAERGHLVLVADSGDQRGTVVGSRLLSAGTTENATVSLDTGFFQNQTYRVALRAVVYRDDGDGVFDEDDTPVTVGEDRVSTRFIVEKTENASVDDGGSLVNTPTGTATLGATETPTETPTATGAPTTPTAGTTTANGPGFGLVGTVLALAAVAAFARRRR